MKIVLFGPSPTLLTSQSRIVNYVIDSFNQENLYLICWDHDTSYYMPDDNGKFFYKDIPLYPIDNSDSKVVNKIYKKIQDIEPDIVISVSDYFEIDNIASIKSSYPSMFKWISVLSIKAGPIETTYKEKLDYIDYALVTNKTALSCLKKVSNIKSEYCHPGLGTWLGKTVGGKNTDKFRIFSNLKNDYSSNLGSFVSTISILRSLNVEFDVYLHTNIDDNGFYDVRGLLKEFKLSDKVKIPQKYNSLIHGDSDKFLIDIYKKSTIVFDPSLCSATGLTVLEASYFGCIPIVSKAFSFRDIGENSIKCNEFIGERHHSLQIISDYLAAEKMLYFYKRWLSGKILSDSCNSHKRVKGISTELFVNKLRDISKIVVKESGPTLIVDNII